MCRQSKSQNSLRLIKLRQKINNKSKRRKKKSYHKKMLTKMRRVNVTKILQL